MAHDGDSGSDEYGLPKVEIVVPDDARELERDVIAYHREERQRRRRERLRRFGVPFFMRYGIAAPFIASAVLIALISGILMTVITPRQVSKTLPSPAPTRPAAPVGLPGGPLPDVSLTIRGKLTRLPGALRPAVIAIIPPRCKCERLIKQLVGQAASPVVPVYMTGDLRYANDVRALYYRVDDPTGILGRTYHASGLTAILVHTDGVVGAVIKNMERLKNIALVQQLQGLSVPGA